MSSVLISNDLNDLYNNLHENVFNMALFDATVFPGFLAFDLYTYSHSTNIFILKIFLEH